MTAHQFGTLKYIKNNNIHIKDARNLNMVTLLSLIKRHWIAHNSGFLFLTDEGLEKFELYVHAKANFRMHEADISPGVKDLLHVNKLLIMRKSA